MDIRTAFGLEYAGEELERIVTHLSADRQTYGLKAFDPSFTITWQGHDHPDTITIPVLDLSTHSFEGYALSEYFRLAGEHDVNESAAYRMLIDRRYGSIDDLTEDIASRTIVKAGRKAIETYDGREPIRRIDFPGLSEAWVHDTSPYAVEFERKRDEYFASDIKGFEDLHLDQVAEYALETLKRDIIRSVRVALVGATLGPRIQTPSIADTAKTLLQTVYEVDEYRAYELSEDMTRIMREYPSLALRVLDPIDHADSIEEADDWLNTVEHQRSY